MSNDIITNGKRVYFYEKSTGLSYYDIPNPSTRLTFPLTAKHANSLNKVIVSSSATVILQPNTFVYGYYYEFDLEPSFQAAGTFVADSVNQVNAIGSFIPSVFNISYIEFRYYDPTKWEQFCTGIYTTNDNRCYYETPGGRQFITKTDTGRLGNLAGSSPGYSYPTINSSFNVLEEDNDKSVGNMFIFIIIIIGVVVLIIITIAVLYGFNFFSDTRKVDSSINEYTPVLR